MFAATLHERKIQKMMIRDATKAAQAEGLEEGLAAGREQGLTEGLAAGREQGLSEGRSIGATEEKCKVIRNMYAMNLPIEQIAQAVEEPIDTVKAWLEQ